MSNNVLSILFEKGGFSFSVIKENKIKHTDFISINSDADLSIETILQEKIKQNLYLKQDFLAVKVVFLTSQFNLVPSKYYLAEKDNEIWISFNAKVYEGDKITATAIEQYGLHFLFSYPNEVEKVLKDNFPNCKINNTSALFLNSIESDNEKEEVFINLHHKTLEILCLKKYKLLFYNVFNVETNNDILYYTLNVYKQLGLDSNQHNLYYFGKVQEKENLLKMLLNFVRNVIPGADTPEYLKNFTHYKNIL